MPPIGYTVRQSRVAATTVAVTAEDGTVTTETLPEREVWLSHYNGRWIGTTYDRESAVNTVEAHRGAQR